MSIQRPPQPPPKKSGLGCLGCGCLFLILLFLLIAGLVGGGIYTGFKAANGIVSSAQPLAFTPYDGGDDVYAEALKKVAAFKQDVKASTTSTLTLSADEINSLITRNSVVKRLNARVRVSLQGDELRLQGVVPSNFVPLINLGVKDRYFDVDATTGVRFNPDTKDIELDFHRVQFGDYTFPESSLPALQASLSQSLNQQLHQNAAASNVLQNAQSITIKDGQFIIVMK